MQKIWIIIQREYWTRVRKPSFIIMSILGPILLALLMVVPIWLASKGGDEKIIQVIDESGHFVGKLPPLEKLRFVYATMSVAQAKAELKKAGYDGILYIPPIDLTKPLPNPGGIEMYAEKSLSVFTKKVIEKAMEKELETLKLEKIGVSEQTLAAIKTKVAIKTINLSEEGEKASSSEALTAIGYFSGFLIYMFIFLYGVKVMRGVLEEKTNRIIEVLISSVKPFELMMGKILGIAGVALTQFIIWAVFSLGTSSAVSYFYKLDRFSESQISGTLANMKEAGQIQQSLEIFQILQQLNSINVPLIFFCFVFYFFMGYLMYAALYAAVGAAADSETDSQQFMLPISIPLIASIVMISAVITDPNSSIAFWGSIFPLTSPVIMMVRVPFIGFSWEILLSMALLVAGFLGAVWLASRIYRVGILMYGKKISYKELRKWLFY
jgi:ABC-2 type transport system permease protein